MSTNNVFSALYPDIWIFPLPTMSDTSPLKKFPYILCLYHYLSFLSHYNTLYENFLSSYCWCSYMGMVSVCCSTSTCDGVETPILGSFTPVYSIITQCEPSEVPRSVHIMGILWLIIKFTIEPLEIRLYSHIKSFTYVFGLICALKYLLPCALISPCLVSIPTPSFGAIIVLFEVYTDFLHTHSGLNPVHFLL